MALVLLLMTVLPATVLLGSAMNVSTTNRASVGAGAVAEQSLEEAKNILSAAMTGSCHELMPCTVTQPNQTVQGFTYRTTLTFHWALIGNAAADVCQSLVVPQVASAVATVDWGPGQHSLSESTIVSLPYAQTNLNDGYLAVQVNGVENLAGAGQPPNFGQQGVVVTVTADTAAVIHLVTDVNGCAFAAVPATLSSAGNCLTAAPCTNYTVSLSPPAGSSSTYVDPSGNPSPSAPITVYPLEVAGTPTFLYDKAATINLTYPSVTGVENGVVCPSPVACFASGQQTQLNPSYNVGPTTFKDTTSSNNGSPQGGLGYDASGPLGSAAVSFDGSSSYVQTATQLPAPGPQTFSVAAWFKTTSSGSIIGFANSQGTSGMTDWDRNIWIDPGGHVVFGVYPGSTQEIVSPSTYNNGSWHFVVAELSRSGMQLFVDGQPVGTNPSTSAQVYSGWWHLGWSNAGQGWPDAPTSNFFGGSLGQMSVFPSALSATQVSSLYTATTVSQYANAVGSDHPTSYWPMDTFAVSGLSTATPTASLLAYDGTSWSPVPAPPGLAKLQGFSCTTSTTCEAVGESSSGSGMVMTATLAAGAWTLTADPTAYGTDLSSISCTSASQCMASGYSLSGGVRTGLILSFNGSSWTPVSTSGVTDVPSVACQSATACVLVGNDAGAPSLYTYDPATGAITAVTLTPSPVSLSDASCPLVPGGAFPTCFLAGTSSSGAQLWTSSNGGASWVAASGIPSGVTKFGAPACTSGSECIIPANTSAGSNPTGTVLPLTGTSGSPWSATVPGAFPSAQWISAVACSSTNCVASGQAPFDSTTQTTVPLLATAALSDLSSWTTVTLPGTTSPTATTGAGCLANQCVTVGESSTGDMLYSGGAGAWSANTDPSTGAGVVGQGFSASVSNTSLPGNGVSEVALPAAPGTDPATLNDLYPFPSGYGVFLGSCLGAASNPPSAATTPGGNQSVTLALSNLALRVVNGAGQDVPNATISLTSQTSGSMSGCNPETYTAPSTGVDGTSQSGFAYGSYSITVNGTLLSPTLQITPYGATYNGVSYPYPQFATITISAP